MPAACPVRGDGTAPRFRAERSGVFNPPRLRPEISITFALLQPRYLGDARRNKRCLGNKLAAAQFAIAQGDPANIELDATLIQFLDARIVGIAALVPCAIDQEIHAAPAGKDRLRYARAMNVTRHLRIEGRVQGVGFRFYMQHKARELGVTGSVRNRLDGTVEAVVQGMPEAVETMITWARRGPRSAIVGEVRVTESTGEYDDFVTLPTE